MDYSIQLKDLPPQLALRVESTVTMDTIGPGVAKAFGAVMAAAGDDEAVFAGPPFVVYPEECVGAFTLVLCMPVAPGCPEPAADSGVTLTEVPGGRAACVVHAGPYEKIGTAYQVLQTWLTANGRTPAGPPREIYLSDPASVPPEELLTEIAWPVS